MPSISEKIEKLIRDALSDVSFSEEAVERVDEIHRSASWSAHRIIGDPDPYNAAYERVLHEELLKRQREIQRLREKERYAGFGESL